MNPSPGTKTRNVKSFLRACALFCIRKPDLCYDLPAWCDRHGLPFRLLKKVSWEKRPLPPNFPPEFLKHEHYRQPPRILVTIPEAQIATDHGYIILPDNSFLVEVAWEAAHICHHPIYASLVTTKPVTRKGTFFSCFLYWHQGFYHWLIDVATRFHGVLDQLPEETVFLVPANMEAVKWRVLELLGIDRNRCREYDGSIPWKLEKLIHATPSAHCGNHNPEAIEWLSSVLISNAKYDSRLRQIDNIYISRSRSLCRRIINESEIKPILEEFNFVPLFLEDFSLDNQIQLFHFATRIIAPHGAGLANIMFCARGTQVMEIFEPTVTRHCYWSLATAKGLSYSCFMATTSAGFQPDPDILVNPRKLRNLLAQSPIGEIAVPHRPQFPNPEKSPPRATARHFS